MQGQISNFSAITHNDGTFRLDAEHYQEEFLKNQKNLSDLAQFLY